MPFKYLTERQKEIFKELVENEFEDKLSFHEDYSGRGMYGDITYGVSGDMVHLLMFIHVLGAELQRNDESLIHSWSTDQLGLGMIFYIK